MGLDQQARYAAQAWPTPRATDGTKGGPNQRGSSGDLMLPSAVNWPTPSSAKAASDMTLQCSDDGRETPNKLGWAVATNWATPNARDGKGTPSSDHESSLPRDVGTKGTGQTLSPAWVAQLQGLPDGWLDIDQDVSKEARLAAVLAPRWPAGMGVDQFPWEAARTATGIKDRAKKLRALGNAVVPAQAYCVFQAIVEVDGEQR